MPALRAMPAGISWPCLMRMWLHWLEPWGHTSGSPE